MALESATFLDELVATNPAGGDLVSQGDDHIRLIKSVLKNTFPGLTSAQDLTNVYRAGGTDVAVTDGGTGASTAPAAATNLGLGTGDTVRFASLGLGEAVANAVLRVSGASDTTGGIRIRSTADRFAIHGAGASSVSLSMISTGQFVVTRSGGSVGTRMEDSTGQFEFPSTTTTASAANAFLDGSNSNRLARSTSSLRYKTDVGPIAPERISAALDISAIRYRSLAPADNPEWSWYGFAAEDVAAVDPRLVHWGYEPEDYEFDPETEGSRPKAGVELKPDGVMYERFVVIHQEIIRQQQATIAALEKRVAALEAQRSI
jgi:hypothetical protein